MMLLISGATQTVQRVQCHLIGRLHSPRTGNYVNSLWPWAADNDCFQGLDPIAYQIMLNRISGVGNCLFVVAPDVVADCVATSELWYEWQEKLLLCGQPRAFVLQDGQEDRELPHAEAYFIGGSTDWKLSEAAADCVDEGISRGAWIHMGRVNSLKRLQQAFDLGCNSVDGTGMSKFPDTIIPRMLGWLHHIHLQGKPLG
jgi:hypothetical protein